MWFFWAARRCPFQNVSLIHVCILSVGDLWSVDSYLPRISSDRFLGVSQDLLSVFSLWVQSLDMRSLICLSLYVPKCKVYELFVGMFCRILCLWSIWECMSWDVRFLICSCAYFPVCKVYKHLSLYVPGCDISSFFMCIVKCLKSLIYFLLFLPGCKIPNCGCIS